MRMKLSILGAFALLSICAHAQNQNVPMRSDSLTFHEFRTMVIEHHPLIRQAMLNSQKGESNLRLARGNFDPKIGTEVSNKFYTGKEYYNLLYSELKIPTPGPLDIKAGFEKNTGDYFNPENSTPDNGLFIAGISIPLIQGVVTDERRTALRQAKAFVGYSEAEQKIMINNLLLRAYMQYWNWWNAYERLNIAQSIYALTSERMAAIRDRASAGDLPLIDTLEAFTQNQNRWLQFQDANMLEIKERMLLSTYMWTSSEDAFDPIILGSETRPSKNLSLEDFPAYREGFLILRDSIDVLNPLLKQYTWKFESLRAEERWKKEKIKPQLNLNYNFLSHNTSASSDINFSTRNYKWGLDFSFPVFMRKGRGDLQLTRIKILETEFEYRNKIQESRNKATALYENQEILRRQLLVAENNQSNYLALLNAERDKFFSGESTVFLVNLRDQQYAEASYKVIDIYQKLRHNENELAHMLGIIR